MPLKYKVVSVSLGRFVLGEHCTAVVNEFVDIYCLGL